MNLEKKSPYDILTMMCTDIVDRTDPQLGRLKRRDKQKCVAAACELYRLRKRARRITSKRWLSIYVDPSNVSSFPTIGWAYAPVTTRALIKIFGQETIGEKRRLYFEAARDVLEVYGLEMVQAAAMIEWTKGALRDRGGSTKGLLIKAFARHFIWARYNLTIEHSSRDFLSRLF